MKEIHANANLKQAAEEHLVRYGGDQFENLFTSAKGSVVVDDNGREILDFTSGQMCATVGHNHPAIVAALEEAFDITFETDDIIDFSSYKKGKEILSKYGIKDI